MSTGFHPLADRERGEDARRECLADLNRVLDAPPHADSASAYLTKWGEDLRELLVDFDVLVELPDGEG